MAVIALAAVALSACGPPPPPDPVPPTPTTRSLPVAHEVRRYDDTSRTIAGLEWIGSRPIFTDLWYPADRSNAPYPLLVFAHGYGVGPGAYADMLERIASAGYVVAAPQYPVLSGWPYGPSDVDDWNEHYRDTSFVIDEMFLETWFDPTLGGMIDTNRIAMAGHSDGAVLAFQTTFGAGHEDGRIRSAIAYSSALYDLGYRPNGRSLLHVLSEHDPWNPFLPSIDYDAQISDPRWTVALWGADHSGPYFDPANPHFAVVVNTTIDFLDMELKGGWWGPFVLDVWWSGISSFV